MSEFKRQSFYVDTSQIEYIEKVMSEKNLQTFSATLRTIISEHQQGATLGITEEIKDDIAEKVAEQQSEVLRKILLATNQTNKVADINSILLNQYFWFNGDETCVEKESKQLTFAKEVVQRRIATARTKSLD